MQRIITPFICTHGSAKEIIISISAVSILSISGFMVAVYGKDEPQIKDNGNGRG